MCPFWGCPRKEGNHRESKHPPIPGNSALRMRSARLFRQREQTKCHGIRWRLFFETRQRPLTICSTGPLVSTNIFPGAPFSRCLVWFCFSSNRGHPQEQDIFICAKVVFFWCLPGTVSALRVIRFFLRPCNIFYHSTFGTIECTF